MQEDELIELPGKFCPILVGNRVRDLPVYLRRGTDELVAVAFGRAENEFFHADVELVRDR